MGDYDPDLIDMMAYVSDSYYTAIQCSGNYTATGNTLYPEFWVKEDQNQNDIPDDWEVPLAQKFCPHLVLEAGDGGLRPVPVDIMNKRGSSKLGWEDCFVKIYSLGGYDYGSVGLDHVAIYNGSDYHSLAYDYPYLPPVLKGWFAIDIDGDYVVDQGFENYFILVPHFEWGNIGETTLSSWHQYWNQQMSLHAGDTFYEDGTTYLHFFWYRDNNNRELILQYYFFYPYNHWISRHEGDWEHINVVLDSRDPNVANIIRVEYYFHKCVRCSYNKGVDYFTIGGTHPKVYVGGYGSSPDGYSGYGSHGCYPWPQNDWPDVASVFNEDIHGNGDEIDFSNYQNIILMPPLSMVDDQSNMAWLLYASHWGHPTSYPTGGQSADGFAFASHILTSLAPLTGLPWLSIIPAIAEAVLLYIDISLDDSNLAPLTPSVQPFWERRYDNVEGWEIYTKQ